MLTRYLQIARLQTTIFPTGVVTARLDFKVHTTSLNNLTNIINMKERVALESNKIEASNSIIGTVLVTTYDPPSGSPGTSA
jgi:hypothetical protein